MFGCAPCVNVKAAAENLRSEYQTLNWLVCYFDRRQSRDKDFLDNHSITSLPAVWFVESGYVNDVTEKIERDTAPAARRSLERAVHEWLASG